MQKKLMNYTLVFLFSVNCFIAFSQAPTITSFSPTTGAIGTLIKINGANLNNLSSFVIGGKDALIISNDGNTLVGLVMPGTTTGSITLSTAFGSATSNTNFTIQSTRWPGISQGGKIVGSAGVGVQNQGVSVSISADGNTAICGGLSDNASKGAAWIYVRNGGVWSQQGSKLVGTGGIGVQYQGCSVSISADGNTALVGGLGDNSNVGAAWIFKRTLGVWTQEGNKLVAAGSSNFGSSVSISADGNTAIIGSQGGSNSIGGAYIFNRVSGTWSQQGNILVGSNGVGIQRQGCAVAISSDGNTAIVGGYKDNSDIGAAWVYSRNGNIWSQQGNKLVGTGGVGVQYQGYSVAISADGNTAIVGGYKDNSDVGAAWIFNRNGNIWSQQGNKLVASGTTGSQGQGGSVAISADGNTAIVGSPLYPLVNIISGATFFFTRYNNNWTAQGNFRYIASGGVASSMQGSSVAISNDGNTAIIGGEGDNSNIGASWFNVSEPFVVRSFSPTSGPIGTTITITGNYFTNASSVTIGGTPVSSFVVNSPTTITAVVASGSTGPITVTIPGDVATSSGSFTYLPPSITTFTPISAGAGTPLTITGNYFTNASSVTIGGTPVSSFIVNSSTSISAIVGNGATGNIEVTAPGGTATSSSIFTYLPPTISGFTPNSGPFGTAITITGSYFVNVTTVTIGGTPVSSFVVNSATSISAIVGNGATGNIVVTTPGGIATSTGLFTYLPPSITSFTPTLGGTGTTININGNYFTNASSVTIGGTPVTSFVVNSSNSITAVVGTGNTGNIIVTTPGGIATSSGIFNYFLAPTISSFSPLGALTSESVIILGANFTGATSVKFGNISASSFTVNSSTQITAVVGTGASGNVSVTTPGGTASLSGFIYYPAPTITTFTPASGTNRDLVVIKGTGFRSINTVKFGNVSAYSFSVLNDTTINAIVGPGASGSVTVTNPSGTGTKTGFIYNQSLPILNGFFPTTACNYGTIVTLTGVNFTGISSVKVGGVNTNFTIASDTVLTFITSSITNSGSIVITNSAGSTSSVNNFIMSIPMTNFQVSPNPFQLCGGTPRVLTTNLPNIYNYTCSNGQSGSNIVINNPGNYTLTATDLNGCNATTSFTVSSFSNCDGYLVIDADSIVNYFDTLNVRIKIKNGVNVFSVFSYLNFNTSQLRLVSSQIGDYLGTNVISQPPTVTGGQIDFGMSKISGDPGSNGDGLIYQFRFVLVDNLPTSPAFSYISPNYFLTNLTLSNISVYNSSGIQPPSFNSISQISQSVACRYYIPVWPGDLNKDNNVTVADILPIGYFYGSTGPIRNNANLQWVAQNSALWGFDKSTRTSSAYKTFADGNGDGVINQADQGAIGFNLGNNHSRLHSAGIETIPLNIIQSASTLTADLVDTAIQQVSLPVNEILNLSIGSTSAPLNNLYGISFDVFFDPSAMNTSLITTDYAGSIFGILGTDFTKIEDRSAIASGRISIGLTRFNTTPINATGGNILSISLPLSASTPTGWYRVVVVPNGCNDQNGNNLVVNGSADSLRIVNPCNIPSGITAAGVTTFCSGGSVLLSANSGTGLVYQWKKDGTDISGANSSSYNATLTGSYSVLISNSTCSITSNIINISVNPTPSVPDINWNGSQFSTTTTGVTYQWFLNGNAISGATSSVFTPTTIGNFNVQVSSNGCSSSSNNYNLIVTGIDPSNLPSIYSAQIMPNPASNKVIVKFSETPANTLEIQLINNLGAVIKSLKTKNNSTVIDISKLSSGIYFIRIIGDDYNQVKKLEIIK